MHYLIINKLTGFEGLKLLAKLGLAIALIGLALFLLGLSSLPASDGSYMENLAQFWQNSKNLDYLLFLVVLVLITITGLLTWVVCLYSSFRLAGPLYRIAIQLGVEARGEFTTFTRLRPKDSRLLKLLYREVRESVRYNRKVKRQVIKKLDIILEHIEAQRWDKARSDIAALGQYLESIQS